MELQMYGNINTYKQPIYLVCFFIFAVIQMISTSAILYGYSSLLVIFKDMKIYQQLCRESPVKNSTGIPFGCNEQDKALNLPFAFGSIFQCLVKIFLGNIIDRIGAKSSQYVACIFVILFGITMAFVDQGREYLIFLAFSFLGISSSLFMLCPYQIVNVFYKKHKSVMMSILSGSVDGSTVVFILFLEIYQQGFSLSKIGIGYSVIVAVLIITLTTFMYPAKHILVAMVDDDVRVNLSPKQQKRRKLHPEDFAASYMSSYSMYQESIQRSLQEMEEAECREALLASLSHSLALQWSQSSNLSISKGSTIPWQGGKYGTITENVTGYKQDDIVISASCYDHHDDHDNETNQLVIDVKVDQPNSGSNLLQHIFSGIYLVACYAISIYMLKLTYFIGNLDKFLLGITDIQTATWYTKMFGYVQFSGVLIAPICSLLFTRRNKDEHEDAGTEHLENVKLLIFPALTIIALLSLMDGLQLAENINLVIPIYFLFLVGNTLTWCFMMVYSSYLFPAKHYCTLLGVISAIIGVFSFLQYPILYFEQAVLNGRQFYTNCIFLVMLLSTVVMPMYLWYFYKKSLKRNVLECKEEDEIL